MTRLLTLALLLLAGSVFAAEAPVRLVLSVGSDLGLPDEAPLQHAEDDAKRLADVFVELGGVEKSRAVVLTRPTASAVVENLQQLRGRITELKASGHRVEVFVFASGHGKHGALHLGATSLALTELRTLVTQTGADLTVTIIDACEAGVSRKGAQRGPAYSLSVEAPTVSGEVFISSSGATESAQEWDVLSGSLFTHHLLGALRGDGDLDGDGRVSLNEAYAYASRRTVANSVDQGQHPQFDVALSGTGELVLTELQRGRAKVVLDENTEGRFVLVSQPRPDVVTEVHKVKGRVVTLAVPPGHYVLRQSRGFQVALQDVELPWGGTTRIDPKAFITRDYSEVALKGGSVEFHAHALSLIGGYGLTPIEGTPARWDVGLSYRYALGSLWGGLSLRWGTVSFRGIGLTTRDDRFTPRVLAGARLWLGPVSVMPALAVDVPVLRQHSVRDDEAAIVRSYPPLPVRTTVGLGVGPSLQLEVPLVGPVFASLAGTVQLRVLPVEHQALVTVGAEGVLGVGAKW